MEFAAKHMVLARKRNNKPCRVLVIADSDTNGQRLASYLMNAYHPEDLADYSGKYIDFSLVFDSETRRNEVLEDLNSTVEEYREQHQEIVPPQDNTVYETGGADEGLTETKSTDWTTYLVIGAAAIVIILLLWERKKK